MRINWHNPAIRWEELTNKVSFDTIWTGESVAPFTWFCDCCKGPLETGAVWMATLQDVYWVCIRCVRELGVVW